MAFELKAINLETVSNPDLLDGALRAMDTEIDLLRTTVNEMVIDHSTQCEYNSGILSGMSEIIADGSTMLSAHSSIVAMVSDIHAQDDLHCSCIDSHADVIIALNSTLSSVVNTLDDASHISNISGTLGFTYGSNTQAAPASLTLSIFAAPAVLSMSNVVAGPAQLTASSVVQERVTEGA